MANKFTYSHPANEVVQVATIKPPMQHKWADFTGDSHGADKNADDWDKYEAHLASLARYPCQGFGKEDDGKEFEKGVHFIVREHRRGHGDGILYNCAVRIPDKGEVGDGTKFRDQLHNILMSGDNLLEKVEALFTFAMQSANSPTVYTNNTGATFLQQGGGWIDISGRSDSGIPEFEEILNRFQRKEFGIIELAANVWNRAYVIGKNEATPAPETKGGEND